MAKEVRLNLMYTMPPVESLIEYIDRWRFFYMVGGDEVCGAGGRKKPLPSWTFRLLMRE